MSARMGHNNRLLCIELSVISKILPCSDRFESNYSIVMPTFQTLAAIFLFFAVGLATAASALSTVTFSQVDVSAGPSASSIAINGSQSIAGCSVVSPGPFESDFEIYRRETINRDQLCGRNTLHIRFDGLYEVFGDVKNDNPSPTGYAVMFAFVDWQNRTYTFERSCAEIAPSKFCDFDHPDPPTFSEDIQHNWKDIIGGPYFNYKWGFITGIITSEQQRALYEYILGPDGLNHGLEADDTVFPL